MSSISESRPLDRSDLASSSLEVSGGGRRRAIGLFGEDGSDAKTWISLSVTSAKRNFLSARPGVELREPGGEWPTRIPR